MITFNEDQNLLRVFVIRHGQTQHNIERILQGHLDIPLNEEGRSQAIKLGVAMKHFQWDAVLTSDLLRCQETLQLVLAENSSSTSPPVTVSKAIRERMMGDVQGMKVVEAQRLYGAGFKDRGESYEEMMERVMGCWELFVNRGVDCKYRNMLVVTHGGVIRGLMKELNGEAVVPFNTSVSLVEIEHHRPGIYRVPITGDVSHLEQQETSVDQLAL